MWVVMSEWIKRMLKYWRKEHILIHGVGKVDIEKVHIYLTDCHLGGHVAVFDTKYHTELSIWRMDKEWEHLRMRTRGNWEEDFKEVLYEAGVSIGFEGTNDYLTKTAGLTLKEPFAKTFTFSIGPNPKRESYLDDSHIPKKKPWIGGKDDL